MSVKNVRFEKVELLLFKTPLYEVVKYNGFEAAVLSPYYLSDIKFHSYCPSCENASMFSVDESLSTRYYCGGREYYDKLVLKCFSDDSHKIRIFFSEYIEEDNVYTLTKIGQQPSLADFQIPNIQKYRVVLKKYYKEFSKAIGLNAHGVGIGSFVYLRRIIETLLEDAHIKAKKQEDWDEGCYHGCRVLDKIACLKDVLPQTLVDNRESYSILSKGLHELDENECLEYFPVLKDIIEIMLDEKMNEVSRHRKEQEIGKVFQKIAQRKTN